MASERTQYVLQGVRDILTVVVAPVMVWLLLSVMEIKLDIVKLQNCTSNLTAKIVSHTDDTKSDAQDLAKRHHSLKVSSLCIGCH